MKRSTGIVTVATGLLAVAAVSCVWSRFSQKPPPVAALVAQTLPKTPASVQRTPVSLADFGGLKGTDLDGRTHWLGRSPHCKAVAVVFLSLDCPISNSYVPQFKQLAERGRAQGFEFYGIVSRQTASRSAALSHRDEYEVAFPVLFDANGELLDRLAPTHTPEAFVLDRGGSVVYRGRIDDRYVDLGRRKNDVTEREFADAIQAVVAGHAVPVPRTQPVGCLVEDQTVESAPAPVTYTRDVAPLIQANCASCHRPGQSAPFSLTSYQEVSQHGRQIALVTRRRIMPPWKPEPGYGHFRDERRLTDREIRVLQQWVDAGKPRGNATDRPPKRQFPDGWQLGRPDLVLELPEPFEVPAAGDDVYQYFVIPTELTEDRYVEAIEYRPGAPEAVHHASLCYDTTGAARVLDQNSPGPGYRQFAGGWGFRPAGTLGGWAPGVTPRRLPDGTARLLEEGANLVVQCHYHPTGKPVRDRPRIGIYFAPDEARQVVGELLVANMDLHIPPNERRHHHQASYQVPVTTTLLAVSPHMHLLGHEIRAQAVLPDGRVVPLIHIADWDFHWQDQYVFATPLDLPAGSRIEMECVYDNSASNSFNPHSPPQPVHWGEAAFDEMGVCFFDVVTDDPADWRVLIQHNRSYINRQYRRLGTSQATEGD